MHGTFGEGIVYFFCVVASVSGVCLGVGVGTFYNHDVSLDLLSFQRRLGKVHG